MVEELQNLRKDSEVPFPCAGCRFQLFMPTGDVWCELTMEPCKNKCSEFEVGQGKIHDPYVGRKLPEQEVPKIKAKKLKVSTPRKAIKKKTEQGRLF